MTREQLAKFNACFDNCLQNHKNHTWFEAVVEGFNAANGQSILTLIPEEAAACKEFAANIQYKSESYNRDLAIHPPIGIDGVEDEDSIGEKFDEEEDFPGYIQRPSV